MSNTDFDPNDSYPSMVRGVQGGLRLASDVDPDQATRSVDLENSTGVPSTYISRNLQEFDTKYKQALSRDLVLSNPYLMDYIRAHPMNGAISQNDLANLDKVSDAHGVVRDATLTPWWQRYPGLLARGAGGGTADLVGALGRIIGSDDLSAKAAKLRESVKTNVPLTEQDQVGIMAQVLTGLGSMVPGVIGGATAAVVGPEIALPFGIGTGLLTMAGIGGLQHGEATAEEAEKAGATGTVPFLGGAAAGTALNLLPLGIVTRPWEKVAPGMINWGAAALKRALATGTALSAVGEIGQMIDAEMASWTYNPQAHYSPDAERMIANMVMGLTMGIGFDAVKAYIDGNQHIPPGLNKEIDNLRAEHEKVTNQALDELLSAVSRTDTAQHGEVGQDKVKEFLQQHPEISIGFNAEKVLQLYGDKLPEPNDGILGWAPDIAAQLQAARTSGRDIRVPLADYARAVVADPNVDKALADFRHVGKNGLSADDIKNMAQAQQASEQQQQALMETPSIPRYLGGLTDSGAPVLDAVRKSLGLDRILPVPPGFWTQAGKGILNRPEFPIRNQGATVNILHNEILERMSEKTVPIKIDGQMTGAELLRGIDINKMPETTREVMTFFRDREKEVAPDVPIYLVNEKEFAKIRRGRAPAGYYDPHPKANYIVLNTDSMQTHSDNWIAHVAIHEMAHAATSREMYGDRALTKLAQEMRDEYKEWLNKNEPGWNDPNSPNYRFDVNYAFADESAHEFIAQGWSSPEVIESLARAGISDRLKATLKLDEGKANMWEAIKAFVRAAMEKIFGKIPDTVMEGVFKWSEDLHTKQMEGKTPPPPTPPDVPIEPPGPTPEQLQLFADQRALGYTKKSWETINKLLNEERQRDVEWKNEQSQKDAERYVKDWWKEDEEKMEPKAREAVYQEPAIAAERFLRFGYFGDTKVTRRRLNGEFLSEDVKSQLNPEYFQKGRGGLHPDDVFPLFGYRSAEAMISDLVGLSNDMKNAGRNPNQHIAQLVKNKLQQMMEEKHGSLKDNILEEAKSRVIGLDGINLAHEDLKRVANLAGIDITPEGLLKNKITREQLREAAEQELDQVEKRGDVDSTQLIDRAQKQGRAIEDFLAARKNIEAFKMSQSRMITLWKTYEMREFEELEAKGKARLKGHVKREPEAFKSEDAAQFHDFIQLFMSKFGIKANGDPNDLLKVLEDRGFTNFRDFVEKIGDPSYGLGGRIIPAPDFLKDVDFRHLRKLDDLTIGESKALWQTLIALDKVGREVKKINVEDRKEEMQPIVDQMKKQIKESHPAIDQPVKGEARGHVWRYFDAVTMMPERFFNRLDLDNPRGVFNQHFSRLFTESSNHYDTMRREYASPYREIMKPLNLNESLEAPAVFKGQQGRDFTSWTRENLITLMLNMGNKQNWEKMYKGRGLSDEQGGMLWNYVMKNAREEEWKFVTGLGEKILNDIKRNKIDPVYLKVSGFPPKNIPVWDVVTPHGTFKGWYYPLIKDRVAFGKGGRTGFDKILDGDDFFSLEIPNPHAKERTGAQYELSLNMQDLPSRIDKMLYDVAFRENMGTMVRLWKEIEPTVKLHQGHERSEAIDAFFTRAANHDTFNSAAAREASSMNEFLRQNIMSFYVGYNIGTVIKHGPTAFVNSIRRIGFENLMRGYAYLLKNNEVTGESWNKWVNSQEEIQRRSRDWAERFGGVYKDFTQTTLAESIRNWGSKPVAFVDMLSSKAEFLGAYLKALDEGQTPQEAVFEASRSVRYSHGTTAPTNTPLIATGTGLHAWATSLYHFFGTMLQNRMEIAFALNRMYRLGREGELKQAANVLPLIMGDVFAYVVFPTMIEEYATGLGREDRRGLGQRLGWATFGGLANAVPYARDILHALEYGVNQEGGLADSAIQPLQQAFKDVAQAVSGKKNIYNAKYAGNLIQDIINLTAYRYGTPREIGNAAKYGWNVSTGVEVPHTGVFKEWYEWGDIGRGITHGSQKMSKIK